MHPSPGERERAERYAAATAERVFRTRDALAAAEHDYAEAVAVLDRLSASR